MASSITAPVTLRSAVLGMYCHMRSELRRAQSTDPEDQDTYMDGDFQQRTKNHIAFLDMWLDAFGADEPEVLAVILGSRTQFYHDWEGTPEFEQLYKIWNEVYNG